MLVDTNTRWQHQQSMWRLAELVLQRNRSLLRLNTLAILPLGLTPASGMIAEFDTHAARKLLDQIDRQTERINDALAETNHQGGLCGSAPVTWRPTPVFKDGRTGKD